MSEVLAIKVKTYERDLSSISIDHPGYDESGWNLGTELLAVVHEVFDDVQIIGSRDETQLDPFRTIKV
jgi:hypothetical protein